MVAVHASLWRWRAASLIVLVSSIGGSHGGRTGLPIGRLEVQERVLPASLLFSPPATRRLAQEHMAGAADAMAAQAAVAAEPPSDPAARPPDLQAPGEEWQPSEEPLAHDGAAPGQACLDLQLNMGFTCQVAVDRIARIFPRGSSELPTQQQQDEALAALAEGGLPTPDCCQDLQAVQAAQCGCSSAFLKIRERIQEQYPTLTPTYLQGSNFLLAAACAFPDTSCL